MASAAAAGLGWADYSAMSAGDVTPGTRLPDAVFGKPGPGWDAFENKPIANVAGTPSGRTCAPGSYMKVDYDGKDELYIVDPRGEIGRISTHTITWHEDGTVTVSPSIAPYEPGGWHGYLEHGIWREV